MKLFFAILIATIAQTAWAAAEGHGGIPTRQIFWQFFNLAILFSALIYFLRQPVRDFFAQRKSSFLDAANKSQAARQEAEKQFLDIKHKLDHLETSRDTSLSRAEAEAADMRKQMVKDAEEMAQRVLRDAEMTIRMEVQKARHDLQGQFIQDAVAAARVVLTKDIGGQDHQKLQTEFAKNLQAVSP